MRKVNVEGEIVEVSEARVVSLRSGEKARVADCIIRDETDQIKLSLWDDQIDKVRKGVRVRIVNGYTSSFKGETRLNVGRYGELEVLEE